MWRTTQDGPARSRHSHQKFLQYLPMVCSHVQLKLKQTAFVHWQQSPQVIESTNIQYVSMWFWGTVALLGSSRQDFIGRVFSVLRLLKLGESNSYRIDYSKILDSPGMSTTL